MTRDDVRPHSTRKGKWSLVEEIQNYILDHGLHPGEPMPTEATLCEELAVSRSSVREAMRTLASLDIVEIRHGHGTYVGQLSLAPLVSGLIFRATLNTDNDFRTLRDVVSLRVAMDLGSSDELVSHYRGSRNDELRALVDQMRALHAKGEPFAEADGAFHSQLLSVVDNQLVGELVRAFWQIHTAVVPQLGLAPASDLQDTVEAHDAILDALEAGDTEAYRRAVLAHYAPLIKALEQARSLGVSTAG